MMHIIATAT